MVARDHAEEHRQASWLELLFDLSFVVAVAQAGSVLLIGTTLAGIVVYGVFAQHRLHLMARRRVQGIP